jgi:hypothetical protein
MRSNRFAQQVREPRATITSKRCGSNLETRARGNPPRALDADWAPTSNTMNCLGRAVCSDDSGFSPNALDS